MNKPVMYLPVGLGMSHLSYELIQEFLAKQAETKMKIEILTTRIPQRDKNAPVTDKLWEPKK